MPAALKEDKPWYIDARDIIMDMGSALSTGQPSSALEEPGSASAPSQGSPLQEQAPPPAAAPQTQGPAGDPALAVEPGPSPDEIDPEIGVAVAEQSAEAAKTASDEDKLAINKELEEIVGGPKGLEEAYREALKRLGGEKEYDPKLDKKDWGLFLMDFGMRMMSESGKWNAQLGGAAGTAGVGALQGMQARQTAEQGRVDAINEDRRGSALEIAQDSTDPKGILWTDKGAYNTRTGQYMKGEGGGILQPGMQPGASNRPFQRTLSQQALTDAGLPADVAARIAQGGAPDPAEVKLAFAKTWDTNWEKMGSMDVVPGTGGMRKRDVARSPGAYEKAQKAWIDSRMNLIWGDAGQQPALTQPGPQAEGRSRPAAMDKYR